MAGGGQQINIQLQEGKKVYFASDQHLGAPNDEESRIRELRFVNWLNQIKPDCQVLFLLGDLFDFWFEYKQVVPRGFVRILGKLAELSDSGIKIYFFTGNHDLWMRDYLEKEIGMEVFHDRKQFQINQTKFFIAHGDGLGPGDKGYKRMKKLFRNKVAQFFFYLLHPDFAVWLGINMSLKNKLISGDEDVKFLGEEKEWLAQYARRKLEKEHFDYFVFGHRHMPMEIQVGENSFYMNLGDWVNHFTYAVFDGAELKLERDVAQ
ncbi:UDP-2,3-diacylglucosamine diphosphatase [Moheibacter lacus]|uniref:UDP-2,3-diacylglucosamine diphosphatase n=1 Tax=Moheibacter lacus TaxID=2745851 RepID=UPI001C7160BC|nr:UDP-2,3-diacylglucosamine diphosphatase [Moheibacter lacus]